MRPTDDIKTLPGVGEKRAILLNKLNIYTIKNLATFYPRNYLDKSKTYNIKDILPEQFVSVKGKIYSSVENTGFKGNIITKCVIWDGTGKLNLKWFNKPYLKNTLLKNNEYVFSGNVKEWQGKLQLEAPDFEKVTVKDSLSFGRIVPIYHISTGLSQKIMRDLVKKAIDGISGFLKDFVPQHIVEKYQLVNMKKAVYNINFPKTNDEYYKARKTLVFCELFLLQTALFKLKGYIKKHSAYVIKDVDCSQLLDIVPFDLTKAQQNVLNDIKGDILKGIAMNRLIQGDVGSGKTVIAMAACYIAIKGGELQGALMAPTEVLALQHYKSIKHYFDKLNIETTLLIGGLKKKEKEEALYNIETGKTSMVIGTHALIQNKVCFNKLGIVITDEQHRFGVRQRGALTDKGKDPHIIIMSATPIPRTLALILYGDMDISIIDSLPPGRTPVETYGVNTSYRNRIYAFIEKEINKGRQVYVICPAIKEEEVNSENEKDNREKIEMERVLDYCDKLKEHLPNVSICSLHGKMKQQEKQYIMETFSKGEISVLVSTTVIEVGINVPNASVMVIENAERFGLAQLHQLRGRVGRGAEKSYCILISDSKSKITKERVKAMTQTNDGFVISRLDLTNRGSGDFFGTKQHGIPDFKIANLYEDLDILKQVQSAAQEVFDDDLDLEKKENENLKNEILEFLSSEYIKVDL